MKWNHHYWNEQREPRRQDLDDIAPANPVMMVRACGHSQEESLSGFTAAPAWVAGRQEQLGSIRVGKWADLTVFAQDLFVVSPSEWPSVPVEMTILNGEVLYRHG